MDRNLVVSIMLSLATVWTIQYFFMSTSTVNTTQGGAVAVVDQRTIVDNAVGGEVVITNDLTRPLESKFKFLLKQTTSERVVENSLMHIVIDESTASFKKIAFKQHLETSQEPIVTIDPAGAVQYCGLTVVNASVVEGFEFVQKEIQDGVEIVTYAKHLSGWDLIKKIIIQNDSYLINVEYSFNKKHNADSLRPSIVFSAPTMKELGADDYVQMVVFNERKNKLENKEVGFNSDTVWHWQGSKTIFGFNDRYFIHTLVSDIDQLLLRAYCKMHDNQVPLAILETKELTETTKATLSFYFGPKSFEHLAQVNDAMPAILDYGWLSYWCSLLLRLLELLMQLLGNFGFAIIALALVLRVPFMPLSIYGRIKADAYQKHMHILNKIRARYKNDPQQAQEETLRYHKEHNLSPVGSFMGCLPSLILLPIMFCLNKILSTHLALYHSPFIGWITDLSAKDPWYILPFFMAVTMLWSQLIAASDEKQKTLMVFMSFVMGAVAAGCSAGLVLYWFVNNIITLIEDYIRKALQRKV